MNKHSLVHLAHESIRTVHDDMSLIVCFGSAISVNQQGARGLYLLIHRGRSFR